MGCYNNFDGYDCRRYPRDHGPCGRNGHCGPGPRGPEGPFRPYPERRPYRDDREFRSYPSNRPLFNRFPRIF